MINNIICKTALAAALVLGVSGNASANECFFGTPGWCLESGFDDATPLTGSKFSIDDQGWMELQIDEVSHAFLTDFVVAERILDPITGAETGLSPLPLAMADYLFAVNSIPEIYLPVIYPNYSATQSAPNQLTLTGLPVDTWGSIDLSFELIDSTGDPAKHSATLIETFTLTNKSPEIKDMSVFAFMEVEVSGNNDTLEAANDQGEMVGFDPVTGKPVVYRQYDRRNELIASVDVAPDHYEVDIGFGICRDMCQRVYEGNNGFDVMLADSVDSAAGNVNMATQYVRTLGPGESMTFTQSLELNPVPVPAAVWLFGSGLIGLIGVARRKQSVAA